MSSSGKVIGNIAGSIRLQAGDHSYNGVGGNINLKSGIAREGDSGDMKIATGQAFSLRRKSGKIELVSGDSLEGKSGNMLLGTGIADKSGDIAFKSGASKASKGGTINIMGGDSTDSSAGDINIVSGSSQKYSSGALLMKTGGGYSSGSVNIETGIGSSDKSGSILLKTGSSSGASVAVGSIDIRGGNAEEEAGDGGAINLFSGSSNLNTGGSIQLYTGTSKMGYSGHIHLQTSSVKKFAQGSGNILVESGDSTKSESGSVEIRTGSSGEEFSSGDINIETGESQGSAGVISVHAGNGFGKGNGGNVSISGGSTNGLGRAGGVLIHAGDASRANGGDVMLRPGKGNNEKKEGQLYILSGGGLMKTKVNATSTIITNGNIDVVGSNNLQLRGGTLHVDGKHINISSKSSIEVLTNENVNIRSSKAIAVEAKEDISIRPFKTLKIEGVSKVATVLIEPSVHVANSLKANRLISPLLESSEVSSSSASKIENALAKMKMISTIAYSDKENSHKRHFSFSIKNGLALPEIVEYGNGGESVISLIDLTALMVESIKSLHEELTLKSDAIIKLTTLVKNMENQLLQKKNKNTDAQERNQVEMNEIRKKLVSLEILFQKHRENTSVNTLESKFKSLKDKLEETIVLQTEKSRNKSQEKASNHYSKDDDIEYFVKLMDESRETFYAKYKDNPSVNVDAEWKSQVATFRAKAYRRVLNRREEANIFAILDKKKS